MGVALIDCRGIVSGTVGAPVDALAPGQPWRDGLAFLSSHEEALAALIDGRGPPVLAGIEHRPEPASGLRPCDIHGFRLPDNGGTVLVFQDATAIGALERDVERQRGDLARAERQLTQAKDLADAASEAKSIFLANLSHELRTPLNVIIGNAEILRDWDPAKLPRDELHTFAEDILDNGVFLLEHINDLLDLAKAEAGGIDLVEEAIEFDEIVDDALALIGRQPDARSLTLRRLPGPGLPPMIGDRRRLRQVMHNLLGNAVKFTADGGVVSVRTFVESDGALTVRIDDDGIGIARESLDRVLQPFGQAGAPVGGRAPAGSGLGLPLAKTLIELHDGTLTLDSSPGEGTRITLRFPATRTQIDG